MVALLSHNIDPHNTRLVSMGKNVLTHNNISANRSFKARLKAGSNNAANSNNNHKNMADYIRGMLLSKQAYSSNSKKLVKNMANEVIRKRERNQRRFITNHMMLMTQHQRLRNNLNKQYANAQNNIASREPNFKNLLKRIREHPGNNSLKNQRNNRLNNDPVIHRIKLEREWLRRQLQHNSNRTTQHMRQIQAWKWLRNSVVPQI
jgi:hypothetical protein